MQKYIATFFFVIALHYAYDSLQRFSSETPSLRNSIKSAKSTPGETVMNNPVARQQVIQAMEQIVPPKPQVQAKQYARPSMIKPLNQHLFDRTMFASDEDFLLFVEREIKNIDSAEWKKRLLLLSRALEALEGAPDSVELLFFNQAQWLSDNLQKIHPNDRKLLVGEFLNLSSNALRSPSENKSGSIRTLIELSGSYPELAEMIEYKIASRF